MQHLRAAGLLLSEVTIRVGSNAAASCSGVSCTCFAGARRCAVGNATCVRQFAKDVTDTAPPPGSSRLGCQLRKRTIPLPHTPAFTVCRRRYQVAHVSLLLSNPHLEFGSTYAGDGTNDKQPVDRPTPKLERVRSRTPPRAQRPTYLNNAEFAKEVCILERLDFARETADL